MDKLSEELILIILKHLDERPRYLAQKTLCTVAQVCKRLNRVATPLLYVYCVLEKIEHADQTIQQALKLSTSIATKPELGRLVRVFLVSYWIDGLSVDTVDDGDTPSAISLGSYDALIALLLCQMTGLRCLYWTIPPLENPNQLLVALTVQNAMSVDLGGARPLSRLTCVRVDKFDNIANEHPEKYWPCRLLSLFMRLPSMQHVFSDGCSSLGETLDWACDPGVSNLCTITLHDSALGSQAMKLILNACKALRKFSCNQQCGNCLGIRVEDMCVYGDLAPAILSHKATLEGFALDLATCHCSAIDYHCTQLASLHELTHLEYLMLNSSAFYEEDDVEEDFTFEPTVPTNLKRLVIHCTSDEAPRDLLPAIDGLLQARATLVEVDVVSPSGQLDLPDAVPHDALAIYRSTLVYTKLEGNNGLTLICKRAAFRVTTQASASTGFITEEGEPSSSKAEGND